MLPQAFWWIMSCLGVLRFNTSKSAKHISIALTECCQIKRKLTNLDLLFHTKIYKSIDLVHFSCKRHDTSALLAFGKGVNGAWFRTVGYPLACSIEG